MYDVCLYIYAYVICKLSSARTMRASFASFHGCLCLASVYEFSMDILKQLLGKGVISPKTSLSCVSHSCVRMSVFMSVCLLRKK